MSELYLSSQRIGAEYGKELQVQILKV